MAFWRTVLVSQIMLVLCWGEEFPCKMWSDLNSDNFDKYIYCQCNSPGIQSKDMKIINEQGSIEYPTEIVDNITIGTKNPPENIYCSMKESEFTFKRYPYIRGRVYKKFEATDFICRSFKNEYTGNCSFKLKTYSYSHPHPKSLKIKYFLSGNGLPKVQCFFRNWYSLFMKCKNININQNIATNHFEITSNLHSQKFDLNTHQIVIPNWESIEVGFQNKTICNCTNISSEYENLICKWAIKGSYYLKKFKTEKNTFTIKDHRTLCISEKLLGDKNIRVDISCRFNLNESAWSEKRSYNFRTPIILPSKPPKILPCGFSYDRDENQIYIFWVHLKPIQWNGPHFGYIAKTDHGESGIIFGNTSALFRNWDASLSSTIYIWSKNSKGASANWSELKLPILTNDNQRPKNVYYDDEKTSLKWDPPNDLSNLIGYMVYWCTASFKNVPICDENYDLRRQALSSSVLKYQFNLLNPFTNMGVAARYIDKIGGGIKWVNFYWNVKRRTDPTPGAGISYYAAPIGVSSLIVLLVYLNRKCQKCRDIKVTLPEGLDQTPNIITPPSPPTVIAGNISPEAVMNINVLMSPDNTLTPPGPENNSPDTNIATEPQSKCSNLSLEKHDPAKNIVSYSSCPEKSVQNGISIALESYSTIPVTPFKNYTPIPPGSLTPCAERSFENDKSVEKNPYS